MKRLVYIITVLIALSQSIPVSAVTDKEMEQARVIATQTYLRYANDGSGYLDALHPSTMAELEKNLKPKEKENIKAFKAVPVPSDFASWDKQKLVDYWSTTAFSHSGLTDKGKIGKNPARKKLNNMKVAAPSASAATAPAAAGQTSAAATSSQTAQASPKANEGNASETNAPSAATEAEAAIDSAQAQLDETRALAEAALAEDDAVIQKEPANTWIYVVILCILVAVVVALVVFASNVMKKSAGQNGGKDQWNAEASDEAKKLGRNLKEANERIEALEAQNAQLKKRAEALTAEITRLRTKPSQATTTQPPIKGIPYPNKVQEEETKPAVASEAAPKAQPRQETASAQVQAERPASTSSSQDPQRQAQTPQSARRPAPAPQRAAHTQPQIRTIYLGQANSKSIFIRADRNLNPGNSVFRLDTSDGLAGTFKVVNDPSVIEKVAEYPLETLGMACVGPDLADTEGMTKIVTDSAGTAIFEGGRWIVMRKAKIHYE